MESLQTVPDMDLLRYMVQIGGAMSAAGEGVVQVRTTLLNIAEVNGESAQVVAFPTMILVQLGSGESGQLRLTSNFSESLRFDQIDALYRLVRRSENGSTSPTEGLAELDRIHEMPASYPWQVRLAGHVLLVLGLTMLLQPTAAGLLGTAILGLVVGYVKLMRLTSIEVLLPVLIAFGCGLAVFNLLEHVDSDEINPIRVLIPPLVTFLPGAMITLGTMELASSEMVSGASRLVLGLAQLALLAFGVIAAAEVVGLPSGDLTDNPTNLLGWWAPWVGVGLYGVGFCLHYAATHRAFTWVVLVLVAAYAGQVVGAQILGGALSSFVGALVMAPLASAIEGQSGLPARLTFSPAFWMLVPGSLGLIGLTELTTGSSEAASDVSTTFLSIVSIALGILAGQGLYTIGRNWMRRALAAI